MSEVINPYAPPVAVVSDVYGQSGAVGYQKVKLFSSQGRIGRLRLITYLFAGVFVLCIAQGVLVLFTTLFTIDRGITWLIFIPMLLFIPYFVFATLLQIQRSHDMDWTGWSILLLYIPLVGSIAGLIWTFAGGTRGMNRFGAPPPPNPLSVKIVGLWLPLLGLVLLVIAGIFAASSPELMDAFKEAYAARQSKGTP